MDDYRERRKGRFQLLQACRKGMLSSEMSTVFWSSGCNPCVIFVLTWLCASTSLTLLFLFCLKTIAWCSPTQSCALILLQDSSRSHSPRQSRGRWFIQILLWWVDPKLNGASKLKQCRKRLCTAPCSIEGASRLCCRLLYPRLVHISCDRRSRIRNESGMDL